MMDNFEKWLESRTFENPGGGTLVECSESMKEILREAYDGAMAEAIDAMHRLNIDLVRIAKNPDLRSIYTDIIGKCIRAVTGETPGLPPE